MHELRLSSWLSTAVVRTILVAVAATLAAGQGLAQETPELEIAQIEEVEEFELEFYRQQLRQGMTVFDIGSNVGMMARYFSNCVGVNGTVHCFEPGERAWARLTALGRDPEFQKVVFDIREMAWSTSSALHSRSRRPSFPRSNRRRRSTARPRG